jgi:hypothetical protein
VPERGHAADREAGGGADLVGLGLTTSATSSASATFSVSTR